MRKYLLPILFLSVSVFIVFLSCSNDDNGEDQYNVSVTEPLQGDSVYRELTVTVECSPQPDFCEFDFDTFNTIIDSTSPYSVSYDITFYPTSPDSVIITATWGTVTKVAVALFEIQTALCDVDIPVILNGDTIPESDVIRNENGCVIGIDLGYGSIMDTFCLRGIERYAATLEEVNLRNNLLNGIDLSPLTTCTKLITLSLNFNRLNAIDLEPLRNHTDLKYLYLYQNRFTEIDLSPLENCSRLLWLLLSFNNLSSIDLSPLANCLDITRLDLNNNGISSIDISPLENCEALQELLLGSNNISEIDLSILSEFFYFSKLYLNHNSITEVDLTPLWDLLEFDFLYLQGNPLNSETCTQVCLFIDEHSSCDVQTDCECD